MAGSEERREKDFFAMRGGGGGAAALFHPRATSGGPRCHYSHRQVDAEYVRAHASAGGCGGGEILIREWLGLGCGLGWEIASWRC